MPPSLRSLLRKLLVAWVDLCRRRAAWVVLLSLASAIGAGAYVVGNFAIDTDLDKMLSADLPFRKVAAELDGAFPQLSDEIVIVIDGATPDLAEEAAARLAARLRQSPKLFHAVFHPASEPFFRRNGLLYLDTPELEGLADRLAAAQPLLATLWRNPSLQGLFGVLTQALDHGGGADLDPVFDSLAEVAEAQKSGSFDQMSWRRLMSGGGEARQLVIADPVQDFTSLYPAGAAIDGIRQAGHALGIDAGHGLRLRLTGSGALSQDELQSVQNSVGLTNLLALAVVCLLLLICFRSLRLVGPVLVTLLIGLVWSAALALVMVGRLNLLSVAFAVLFIGIGVDFGIHFALRYREGMSVTQDSPAALRWAAAGVAAPLALCATAAGIGFFSFLPTQYNGLAELGLIAGASMFVALFANLTLLPALLSLLPLGTVPPTGAIPVPTARFSRPIVIGAAILAAGAALLAPRAHFDFDPLSLKDPRSESVRTLQELMKDGGNSPYTLTVLAANAEEAGRLAAKLSPLPEVSKAVTIGDFVPADQPDKLATIRTMALFLSPLFTAPELAPPTPAQDRAAWADLSERLAKSDSKAAAHLRAAIGGIDLGRDEVLAELQQRLLGALPQQLAGLRDSLTAMPVTMADLPDDILSRYVAADGRARVDIDPKDNLDNNHRALRRFVDAVRPVAPNATGMPVIILEAGRTVIEALRTATILTLAVLFVVFGLLLRNLRDVALVFAPLILAALVTVALMVVTGLVFNYVNIIALPLLFGLGIANGIQFVYRERLEQDPARLMRSTTPRAVIFSALATIDSFGSMALSPHRGTASMGILLGIAISLTLLSTLIVLPAMMRCFPAHHRRP